MRIILASNSPRRREILSQLGVEYEVKPSDYDEKEVESDPYKMVMLFAHNKARSIAKNINEEALVIGADTIVYKDEIMGKPKDKDDAAVMLTRLSGTTHSVITGISVIKTPEMIAITDYEETLVKFKVLSQDEIKAYIDSGEPGDKAGAYAIQGLGSLLVEKIDGCYFNVVGLPVYKLSTILEKFGLKLLYSKKAKM
ncbi:Maf family protein [Lutispora thermophila]|uniref:dTTP/UTP pyrophosphatase n=1 Tax=Lutispora thermophila DSM 19022 TaxID=1122184 RepID=A0A1M6FS88_9FIRM|nr:Maf family protein [Lutispora thermophila]SHJ00564.1 septum formation protein [Lutispora thermophila DSM 19022]